ncbi:YqaA family protein [Natronoflexus pectinivorans]|uniref:Membrane protein YqaA with SNARE-associated domain n=1 Tax=Natronoflexus pectinivorans TaxID=682526 RepID=A0A4R2GL77_9BACT|nr:VTT domain-containing protein [Natronoflexus pectinivorans]TCO08241.1 membrane protein YqaA with SNARE-associated domain [Natronoflexus pectinivorans]
MFTELGYLALFAASFLAATILPFSSEAVLSGMLVAGFDPYVSLVVATIGNWLGGMSSYYIGWLGKWHWIEKYLRIPQKEIEKVHAKIKGKEGWVAFFTWLPGIGDPIAVVLGLIKSRVIPTAIWMFIGKALRYAVWGYLTLKAMELF